MAIVSLVYFHICAVCRPESTVSSFCAKRLKKDPSPMAAGAAVLGGDREKVWGRMTVRRFVDQALLLPLELLILFHTKTILSWLEPK